MNRLAIALTSLVSALSFAAPLNVEAINAGPGGFLVTSTLITGEKEAVLVDAQLTLSEAHRVAAKVLESGKTLTTIVITHGHPDHFFGLEVFKAQFPGAKIIASAKVVAEAKADAGPSLTQWKPVFGANLTSAPVFPEVFDGKSIELEGQKLELIALGEGESHDGTAVWVPSAQTLIAGDVVFDGVHAWLAEAGSQARRDSWLKNLATLKALKPKVVIGGHRAPDAKSAPESLDAVAAYVRDFGAAQAKAKTAAELTAAVNAKHGKLALPVILDIAAAAAVPAKK